MSRWGRGIAAVSLLAGCTAEEPGWAFGQWEGVDEVEEALTLNAGDWQGRSRVSGGAPLSLFPGEAPFAELSAGDHRTLVAVSRTEQHVGVLYDIHWARLLAFADEAHTRPVTGGLTALSPFPGEDSFVGAMLPPGVPVVELDALEGQVQLAAQNDTFRVAAWAHSSAVDVAWDQQKIEWPRSDNATAVAGDWPILDTPYGEAFAWTQPFSDANPELRWVWGEVLEEQDEHLLLQLDGGPWQVTGWMHRDAIAAQGIGGKGASWGCGGCGGFGLYGGPVVPAGTWLYDAPDGALVGRTTRSVHHPDPDSNDWAPLELDTPLASLQLWVEPNVAENSATSLGSTFLCSSPERDNLGREWWGP